MSPVLALALATLAATPVTGVPSPRAHGAWVTDLADVIPPADEARMNLLIDRLERDQGTEIAIVTVDDCEGTPKAFSTALFLHWGIGKAGLDNGLLILLVMDQRRLEMEPGLGLEPVLGKGWLTTLQQDVMVPKLKAGQHGAALHAGLVRVEAELRTHQDRLRRTKSGAVSGAPAALAATTPHRPSDFWVGLVALAFTFVVAPVGLVTAVVRAVRKDRTCTRCSQPMRLLDEAADDAHLAEGQRAEEAVGSMNYLVYSCDPCQNTRVLPRSKWFSGHGKCNSCSFKTLQRRTVTLENASYTQGGRVQVTETCGHCHHRNTFTRSTPRLTRSTSSSGSSSSRSSSSGFGGGRSGGGGAGSSW